MTRYCCSCSHKGYEHTGVRIALGLQDCCGEASGSDGSVSLEIDVETTRMQTEMPCAAQTYPKELMQCMLDVSSQTAEDPSYQRIVHLVKALVRSSPIALQGSLSAMSAGHSCIQSAGLCIVRACRAAS